MKPDEQRIAIAEACPNVFRLHRFERSTAIQWANDDPTNSFINVDPLTDLNAMHAAERSRIYDLDCSEYYDQLETVIGRDRKVNLRGTGGSGFSGWIAHATATQRAEAFLKTLGLWTP